jgi:hypothetical protein
MRTRRVFIALQLLLALLAFSGCSSWKALNAPPAQYLAKRPGALLRLNTRQETWLKLHNARVSGDSLIGEVWERGSGTAAFPLDSVMYIEASQLSTGKTVGLMLLGGVVVGTIVFLSALSSTLGD